MGLKYVVITSVTRDDLEDGGAEQFVCVIKNIQELNSDIQIEALIPDFHGNNFALKKVCDANPDVINHNLETVKRLYPKVRPKADYSRSLELLRKVKDYNCRIITKSGIMLGLGEKDNEVLGLMKDLCNINCDIFTAGQYLKPGQNALDVKKFVHPDEFKKIEEYGIALGFKNVFAGPFVRSSYHAQEIYKKEF